MTLCTLPTGTFFKINDQLVLRGYGGLKSEVSHFQHAIAAGVKFFDGAIAYGNDHKLREALNGLDRRKFIVSSKIPSFKLKDGPIESFIQENLDILYLHGPDVIHKEVMDALVELRTQGRIQHIGLCNVKKRTLEALVKAGYPISVVQNEVNPFFWDEEVIEFCKENKMAVVGYRPFGDDEKERLFQNEILGEIGARVQGSVQEIILQWINQKGITPIPHSKSLEHIRENLSIPKWHLSEEDMRKINGIKEGEESTCKWEKKLDQELLKKSEAWIGTIS